MTNKEFKKLNSEELKEYGNELPLGKTYDNNGNILTHKDDNTGFWYENTFDSNGKQLSSKTSEGDWEKATYDEDGNDLTYKNSYGIYEIKGEDVSKKEYDEFIKEKQISNFEMEIKVDDIEYWCKSFDIKEGFLYLYGVDGFTTLKPLLNVKEISYKQKDVEKLFEVLKSQKEEAVLKSQEAEPLTE